MSTKANRTGTGRRRRPASARARPKHDPGEGLTIVHITAEYGRYARTGGLGEAVAGLAEAQARAGHRVTVFVPLYAVVRPAVAHLTPVAPPHNFELGFEREDVRFLRDAGAARAPEVVFIDVPRYFDRPGLYGDAGADYPDNARRFAVLSLAALIGAVRLLPRVDVIHAHDWHTALAPVYLRTDPRFAELSRPAAAVFTVHNAGYQGIFEGLVLPDLGVRADLWRPDVLESGGSTNLLKGALAFADVTVTVSPTHARELLTDLGGFGLHAAFRALGDRLIGITNGIDQAVWDPATDPDIAERFSAADLSGKARCKEALQIEAALPVNAAQPLFGMSARLVEQKGLDLILASEFVRSASAQFVFLGSGEMRYHDALRALAQSRPANVAVVFEFDDAREHRLLAGADFLLMPSLYEPCGLTQMRAQRYGAPVVARRVGGLCDTVDEKTGFLFDEYDPVKLSDALARADRCFGDATALDAMRRRAMARDFGWARAIEHYAAAYAAAGRHASAAH